MKKGTRKTLAFIVAGLWVLSGLGLPLPAVSAPQPEPSHYVITIATSTHNQFVGAVDAQSSLFVGFLNGTVVRMDPVTGVVTGLVVLPDGNSAAHLAYYNGNLFVGTEYLGGAKNIAPYHVYKVDPVSMAVKGEVQMNKPFANGLVVPLDGYIWAADGHCTLYKIDPATMRVMGTLLNSAEDELASDGVHYWAECKHTVNVLNPTQTMPRMVASGSLEVPNRPRGFFIVNSSVYSSGTLNYALYAMTVFGNFVLLQNVGKLGNQSHPTRDTLVFKGMIHAYQTGKDAETHKLRASIFIFTHLFRLKGVIKLPGLALPADASQHTLFLHKGKIYFVTRSVVGLVVDVSGRNLTKPGGPYRFGQEGASSPGTEQGLLLSLTGPAGLMHVPIHHSYLRRMT